MSAAEEWVREGIAALEPDVRGKVVDLLKRLVTFDVAWLGGGSYDDGEYRNQTSFERANLASSWLKTDGVAPVRHVVALDLDIPAYLVPSSTEGHSHLYIDVPEGVPHEVYMRLLDVLAEARVIEPGYAQASKARGHTDLRFPWVKKQGRAVL